MLGILSAQKGRPSVENASSGGTLYPNSDIATKRGLGFQIRRNVPRSEVEKRLTKDSQRKIHDTRGRGSQGLSSLSELGQAKRGWHSAQ